MFVLVPDAAGIGVPQREPVLPLASASGEMEWARIDRVAKMLDVKRTTATKLIADRRLEAKKLGRATLVSMQSVRKLIADLPAGPDRSSVAALCGRGRPRRQSAQVQRPQPAS